MPPMNMPAPHLAFLGTTEILVILGLLILLFGARKIPQLMKGFGEGVREFKRASRDARNEQTKP